MKDKISLKKIEHYKEITKSALEKAKKSILKGKGLYACEIISMVENYLSDAEYFKKQKDFVSCFAALNYAHGWLDSGVRLDVFNVKDNKLFTVK